MPIFFVNLLFILFFNQPVIALKSSESQNVVKVQQSEFLDQIAAALKTGSAKELIKKSFDPIEIGLSDKKQSYGASHAEIILKNFFVKYPPTSFEYVHKGASQDGLFYVIGRYTHKSGVFQVYILIKSTGNETKIDTIDFSNE
jgi:hypothetical protein